MSNNKASTIFAMIKPEVDRLRKFEVRLSVTEVPLNDGDAVVVTMTEGKLVYAYAIVVADEPSVQWLTDDNCEFHLAGMLHVDGVNLTAVVNNLPDEFVVTEESIKTLLSVAVDLLAVKMGHSNGYRGNNLKTIQSTTKGVFIVEHGQVVTDATNAMGGVVTASHATKLTHTSAIGGYVEIVETYGYMDNDKFVITFMTSDSALSPDMIILGICAVKLALPAVNSVALDLSQSPYLATFFSLFNESGRAQLEEYVTNMTDGGFVCNDGPMFEEDQRTFTSGYLDGWVNALEHAGLNPKSSI